MAWHHGCKPRRELQVSDIWMDFSVPVQSGGRWLEACDVTIRTIIASRDRPSAPLWPLVWFLYREKERDQTQSYDKNSYTNRQNFEYITIADRRNKWH